METQVLEDEHNDSPQSKPLVLRRFGIQRQPEKDFNLEREAPGTAERLACGE